MMMMRIPKWMIVFMKVNNLLLLCDPWSKNENVINSILIIIYERCLKLNGYYSNQITCYFYEDFDSHNIFCILFVKYRYINESQNNYELYYKLKHISLIQKMKKTCNKYKSKQNLKYFIIIIILLLMWGYYLILNGEL